MLLILFSSCSENYSSGNMIGTISKFSKTGFVFKTWDGSLDPVKINSQNFKFSIDRDSDDDNLIKTIDSAMNYGWKVELSYIETFGKNWFSNRGQNSIFIKSCNVLDRNYSIPDSCHVKDTVVTIIIPLDSARKMNLIK